MGKVMMKKGIIGGIGALVIGAVIVACSKDQDRSPRSSPTPSPTVGGPAQPQLPVPQQNAQQQNANAGSYAACAGNFQDNYQTQTTVNGSRNAPLIGNVVYQFLTTGQLGLSGGQASAQMNVQLALGQ